MADGGADGGLALEGAPSDVVVVDLDRAGGALEATALARCALTRRLTTALAGVATPFVFDADLPGADGDELGGGGDLAEALPRVVGAFVRELLRGAELCRWPLPAASGGDAKASLFDHALWLRIKQAQWPWLAHDEVSRAVVVRFAQTQAFSTYLTALDE